MNANPASHTPRRRAWAMRLSFEGVLFLGVLHAHALEHTDQRVREAAAEGEDSRPWSRSV